MDGGNEILQNFIKEFQSEDFKKSVYTGIGTGDCINDIERTFGFYNNQISKCCRGQIKKSYGYIWRYEDESEEYNDD